MSDLYVIFNGPPSHNSGQFVEVEDLSGRSVSPAETGADWVNEKGTCYWKLGPFTPSAERDRLAEELRTAKEELEASATINRYMTGQRDRLAAELDAAKTALCVSQMQTLAAINVGERAQAEAMEGRKLLSPGGSSIGHTERLGKPVRDAYAAARAANERREGE